MIGSGWQSFEHSPPPEGVIVVGAIPSRDQDGNIRLKLDGSPIIETYNLGYCFPVTGSWICAENDDLPIFWLPLIALTIRN